MPVLPVPDPPSPFVFEPAEPPKPPATPPLAPPPPPPPPAIIIGISVIVSLFIISLFIKYLPYFEDNAYTLLFKDVNVKVNYD